MGYPRKPSKLKRVIMGFFTLIGVVASIITIIAWISSGTVSYPIVFPASTVTEVKTVVSTYSTTFSSTTTSTSTSTQTVPAPYPEFVNFTGSVHKKGTGNTATGILFTATSVNPNPVVHMSGKEFWTILPNNVLYSVTVFYTNWLHQSENASCGTYYLSVGADTTLPPQTFYC